MAWRFGEDRCAAAALRCDKELDFLKLKGTNHRSTRISSNGDVDRLHLLEQIPVEFTHSLHV
jgi:hypothetical protein